MVLALADSPGGSVPLPSGGRLSPRMLQMLGWGLGGAGGMEALHYLLESAFERDGGNGGGGQQPLSYAFLKGVEATIPSFDTNPIYALLHEVRSSSNNPGL